MSTHETILEITVDAAPDVVAGAITGPAGLATWLCDDARSEGHAGGRLTFHWHGGRQMMGRWATYDPPTALAWRWHGEADDPATDVAFDVAADGPGTRLTATVSGDLTDTQARAVDGLWRQAVADLKVYAEEGTDARELRRPVLGIFWDAVKAGSEKAPELPVEQAVLIVGLVDDSGAKKAGLAEGDVLMAIDGQAVSDYASLGEVLGPHVAGDTVSATLWRAGAEEEVPITLGSREQPDLAPDVETLRQKMTDVTGDLTGRLATLLDGATEAEAEHAPAEGEWSIKRVLGHVVMAEDYSLGWLSAMATGGNPSPWSGPGAFELRMPLYDRLPIAELGARTICVLRETEALVGAILDLHESPPAPVFHQLASHVHWAAQHTGEHLDQIEANLASARSG